MTLEHLRIFVAVAQIEHFTRASEQLGTSQSVVSAAIAALEAELNVVLFDRSRRHVELTAAGNALLEEAEDILSRVNAATKRMEDITGMRAGRIAIAASQTVAHYWLPRLLGPFHATYPGLQIDVIDGNSTDVERRVLQRQVDFGIIEQDAVSDDLQSDAIHNDRLVLVVGPKHPWFTRSRVEWSELAETSWIMREPGSGTRALFESALVDHDINPSSLDVALVFRSGEAIVNAVVSGRAAAVVSELVVVHAAQAGVVKILDTVAISRAFNSLILPGRPHTRAAVALRRYIGEQGILSADHNHRASRSPNSSF